MANDILAARSAFTGWKPVNNPHLSLDVSETLTLASLAATRGNTDQLKSVIWDKYQVVLPDTPQRVEGNDITFIWTGPHKWIAMAERGQARDLETELKPALAGLASVVDQSDARAVVRVSGPRARDVLAKGLPIDLHPRVFKTNSVAITHANHIGVVLWQTDDKPTYAIAMFRGFADSFTHWLHEAAAEFVN